MIDPAIHNYYLESLGAYALDALEESEAQEMELHLDECPECSRSLAELRDIVTPWGLSVAQQTPPEGLKTRVVSAISGIAQEPPTLVRGATFQEPRRSITTYVLPLAAAIVIGLFTASLAMNLHTTTRVGRLEQQNATLTTRMNSVSALDTQMLSAVQQLRDTNYMIADPGTLPLVLESPTGVAGPHGVMLVSNGGQRAIIMVAGMKKALHPSGYRVWLMRPGHKIPVGLVQVDESGWGTMSLLPPESLFRFEWVALTMDDSPSPSSRDAVLRTKITAAK